MQNSVQLSPAIIQASARLPSHNRQRCLEDFCIFWDISSLFVPSAICLRRELLCNRWVLENDFRETGLWLSLWPWHTQVYVSYAGGTKAFASVLVRGVQNKFRHQCRPVTICTPLSSGHHLGACVCYWVGRQEIQELICWKMRVLLVCFSCSSRVISVYRANCMKSQCYIHYLSVAVWKAEAMSGWHHPSILCQPSLFQ